MKNKGKYLSSAIKNKKAKKKINRGEGGVERRDGMDRVGIN